MADNQVMQFTITIAQPELELIRDALSEMPYKRVGKLVSEIERILMLPKLEALKNAAPSPAAPAAPLPQTPAASAKEKAA